MNINLRIRQRCFILFFFLILPFQKEGAAALVDQNVFALDQSFLTHHNSARYSCGACNGLPEFQSVVHSTSPPCTATVIGPQTILTAAHCLASGEFPSETSAKVIYKIDRPKPSTVTATCIWHKEAESINLGDKGADSLYLKDVALCKTEEQIKITERISVSFTSPNEFDLAILAGFGCTSLEEENRITTRYVGTAPILSNKMCEDRSRMVWKKHVKNYSVCTNGPSESGVIDLFSEANVEFREGDVAEFSQAEAKNCLELNVICEMDKTAHACHGDSGGPLLMRPSSESNRKVVIGVATRTNGEKDLSNRISYFEPLNEPTIRGFIKKWQCEDETKEIFGLIPDNRNPSAADNTGIKVNCESDADIKAYNSLQPKKNNFLCGK